MVSILPMVDLLGNTAVDWFCILSYFRLDTLPVLVSEYTIVYEVTEPLIPPEMLNDSCTHSKQPHDQWFLHCIGIE